MENAEEKRDEPDDDFNIPFADDSEDEQGPVGAGGAPALDESMLQLSHDGSAHGLNNSNLSGLEDSPTSKRTREEEKPRKKRRKRRKVVIDSDKTELSNDHIRNMLKDTSDIVRKMIHPAAWDGEDPVEASAINHGEKPYVPCLTQPFLVDEADRSGAYLHPRLRKLWEDSYWRALGKTCPFKRRDAMEDDNDSIENVRREEEVDDSKADESDLEVPFPDDDEANKQEPDDFDMPQPDNNDDEKEDEPVDAPAMDIDSVASSVEQTGNDGDLDLGLVNDMGIDSDDEERQAAGEEASSTAKWHKHTVRVFKHLKKCMKDPDQVVDADVEAADLPEQVQFHEITKNVRTRRNAASVFFEILQLKTWDFIEVDQQEPYGEINISPGVRFGEDVPN
jgi:cohesin complex subunit SCC1